VSGLNASRHQRLKVAGQLCIVTAVSHPDPAHLVPRGLGGCDDADCVVPLHRFAHRRYDNGTLDLLPHLEPNYRREIAHAVEYLGLIRTLERLTNERWVPLREAA
jgi:hypothetical protein